MDKIHGLSNKEVEEQIQKGNVNTLPKDNLKSNWKIIADNVFTLFNLYNLIIAIALISVKAYKYSKSNCYKKWKREKNRCRRNCIRRYNCFSTRRSNSIRCTNYQWRNRS